MSGHNKWSKIKNKKGKEDAKRAKEFTKLGRAIIVAVRSGGENPDYNPALKTAIEKAKSINMPNDNIQRAIKKGTSDLSGDNYEEITYEGYGPSGIAVIVECLSDNRNRTAADVRHAFDKFGGNLGTNGSVAFMFDHYGVLVIDSSKADEDKLMLDAMDADVIDIKTENGITEIYTSIENFVNTQNILSDKGYLFEASEIMYIPKNYQKITDKNSKVLMEKLIDFLEDNDDVQEIYHNWENYEE